MNLQTSDQFIELLHELQEIITKYRVLDKYSPKKNFLENNLSSRSERLKALNDEFWSITESWLAVIRKIDSFYMKRKVLLSSYEKSITKIKDFGDAVEDNLWKLRTSLLEEQYYEEFIMQQIKALKYLADNLLEVINTTINNVQQDFLGKLYKK